MDLGDAATILRNILLLSALLSVFFIALSIDSIKYYTVLHQVSQEKLEASFARSPKFIRAFYLRNLSVIYLEKYSRQQKVTTYKVRRYLDSAIPFAFFLATPIGLFRAISDATPSVVMYLFFLVALPIVWWRMWIFGKHFAANSSQ